MWKFNHGVHTMNLSIGSIDVDYDGSWSSFRLVRGNAESVEEGKRQALRSAKDVLEEALTAVRKALEEEEK